MSAGKRVRALAIAATCSLAAVLTVALPSQPVPAQAADMAAFQAGNIISDAVFYDSTSMSAAAIQSFLAKKGSSCVAGWGRTCLKNYRETTGARAADSYCTGGLAAIGGSVTPVTAASGRTGSRSATQSIPSTTLQTATAITAETAMNDFVLSDSEGNMEPSQRGDHTAGSAPMRKAGR